MSRFGFLLAVLLWAGVTLVLAELRALRRVPLRDRLRPYVGISRGAPGRSYWRSQRTTSSRRSSMPIHPTVCPSNRLARVPN